MTFFIFSIYCLYILYCIQYCDSNRDDDGYETILRIVKNLTYHKNSSIPFDLFESRTIHRRISFEPIDMIDFNRFEFL